MKRKNVSEVLCCRRIVNISETAVLKPKVTYLSLREFQKHQCKGKVTEWKNKF